MEVNKEKIRYILIFFLRRECKPDAEIVNSVYGIHRLWSRYCTVNYAQLRFRTLRHGNFHVKAAAGHAGRRGNFDKISLIIQVDRHASSSIIVWQPNVDRNHFLASEKR